MVCGRILWGCSFRMRTGRKHNDSIIEATIASSSLNCMNKSCRDRLGEISLGESS